MSTYYHAIGTMTGTSMDGLEAALIRTDGDQFVEFVDNQYLTYPVEFQDQLKQLEQCFHEAALAQPQKILTQAELLTAVSNVWSAYPASQVVSLSDIAWQSYQYHKQLVLELLDQYRQLLADYPTVIGLAGQTFYHNPERQISWQLSAPQWMAQTCQLPVVAEFRQPDINLGGQGAPLAPKYHQALVGMQDLELPVAIINCGGIANISYITGASDQQVTGFDVGPGCVLLDRFVRERTQGQQQLDKDGYYAQQGYALISDKQELCESVFANSHYINQPAPKSLDSYDLVIPESVQDLSLADGCATLARITAYTIERELKRLPKMPQQVILVGGGWHHPVITRCLTEQLPLNVSVATAEQLGWPNKGIEAQIFAYLAVRSLQHKSITTPQTTGRRSGQVVGQVFVPEG